MVFKPKKKAKEDPVEKKRTADKKDLAELRKKIAEAQADLDAVEDEELEEEIEDEPEEVEEDSEDEIENEPPEIEPPEIEENKSVKPEKEQVQDAQLKLTAEEVVAAIEFNIARAGQLLQLLK